MHSLRALLLVLVSWVLLYAVPQFTVQPTLTKNGAGYQIEFGLNEATDVEVAVVRLSDSSIVRHLAAGKLGDNAPAPLTVSSLSQTLAWDGTDDLGAQVTDTASLGVRVRAGMSVSLDKLTTPDVYCLGSQVFGVAADDAGHVYIQSTTGTLSTTTLRCYDSDGNYVKTVYPAPGSLTSTDVTGYGINTWASGSWYSPRVTASSSLNYTPTLVGTNSAWLMNGFIDGQLNMFSVGGYPTTYLSNQLIQTTGATSGQKPLITSPALPYWRGVAGDAFLCPAPGKDYLYLSGIFETGQDQPANLLNTFYKEGQIYRINLQTGVTTSWMTMDSVPMDTASRHRALGDQYLQLSAFRGMATDDSGRVFVCDRIHKCIAVYDTNANLLGSIPVNYPELVAVNRFNGAIYVLSEWMEVTGLKVHGSLFKFSGWRPGYTRVDSLMNFMTGFGDAFGQTKGWKTFMALSQSSTTPVLWCAGGNHVWSVADEGSQLTLRFDMLSKQHKFQAGFDRLAVDRKREVAYINDGWDYISKIEDWSNPVAVPCSTTTGAQLYATDMTVSPTGMLYARSGNGSRAGDFSGPVTRYTLDHRHAPVPFKNSSSNVLTPYIYSRYGAGLGEKGLSVAPNGDVAVIYMSTWVEYIIGIFGDSINHSGDTACDTTKPWNNRAFTYPGGYPYPYSPRYDLQGNIYVGAQGVQPTGYAVPAGFAGDDVYKFHMGSIVKLPAGTKNCRLSADYKTFTGASVKVYSIPMTTLGTSCVCRSSRFDVDPYGRLFVPDFFHNQVTVYDNEGTQLTQFGHYGNIDSWGPGSPVPEIDFPLAGPLAVASSDNFIYVNDMISNRLMRVQMNYALENIHLPVSAVEKAMISKTITLFSKPNPFKPSSTVSFSLPSRTSVRLDVYSASGRLVKSITKGMLEAGTHQAVWNARDAAGSPVAAGIYVYRLAAGNRILTYRTVLTK